MTVKERLQRRKSQRDLNKAIRRMQTAQRKLQFDVADTLTNLFNEIAKDTEEFNERKGND